MKKVTGLLLILLSSVIVHPQSLPDSVMTLYNQVQTSTIKGKLLLNYLKREMKGSATENVTTLLKQYNYFTEKKDETGINYIRLGIGILSWRSGEFNIATKYIVPALKYFEEKKDSTGMLYSLDGMGSSFANSQNYEQAMAYYRKSLPLTKKYNDPEISSAILNNIADCFIRMNLPDSALTYIQEAVSIGTRSKDTASISYSVGTTGEVYMLRKEYEIARPFLKQSIHYSLLKKDRFGAAYSFNCLAQSFFETRSFDSSILYARQAIHNAQPDYKYILMRGYEWLYKNYEKLNRLDSVYKYYRFAMTTKDSLFSIEKNRSIQSVNFQEQIRQQELDTEKKEVVQQRKQNIQYALLALGIITFIITFLLLSRKHITNTKLIQFLGVVALLLVFEFLNLLLHPFLERITHHSPVLMLLALVCIAALLVPMHHKLEHWATHKLVEKNKAIRLAAAKKTIEELEK